MSQFHGENPPPLASNSGLASAIVPSESTDQTKNPERTQALEQLVIARVALQTATENYVAACEAIEIDCKREPTSSLDKRALQDIFLAINSELVFPPMYAQRLWNTGVTLSGLRNRSSTLSPVNLLPSKILTKIFVEAIQADRASRIALAQRARDRNEAPTIAARLRRPDMTTVISSVNSHWRQIAIQTQEIWSHIELGESGARADPPFAKARLWLERSKGSPIDVAITTTGPAAKIMDVWGILPLLASHETNFQSLDLHVNTVDEVHAVLARWLNEGAPQSLRSLTISIPWGIKPGDSPHAVPLGLLQREQRDAFFEPIRRLSLDGTYLAWNGPAFRNLVDLRLSRIGSAACPTVDQFVAILESSPALCTLWLRHMNLRVGSRLDSAPVKMKTLQILGLEHVEPQGLCLLLPLLAPQLELYVKFEAFPRELEVDEALTDLFARSKVEELHLSTYIHPAQLPRMLARLQHLRIFMWRGVNIGDNFFKAIASNTLIANSQSNVDDGAEGGISANAVSAHICPNLHALDFQECSISAAALRELVINRAIPKLTIAGCDISVDGTRDDALRLMDDFEKCLNDAVPDLLLSENGLVVD